MPTRTYAVLDFETTGLYPGQDRIIEVGAVLVREGRVVETFSQLMDPGFPVPSFITGLTGITTAMVRGQPKPQAVMPRLRRFLGEHRCVAHNASFDRRFFDFEMDLARESHERTFLCSMLLARRLIPEAPNHKLGTLVQHLGLRMPDGMQAHRALADALLTSALWQCLGAILGERLGGQPLDLPVVEAVMKKPKGAVANYLATVSRRSQTQAIPPLRREKEASQASRLPGDRSPAASSSAVMEERGMAPDLLSSPVIRDPRLQGGSLVFSGTSVPVAVFLDYLNDGESIDEFLANFPQVRREQAVAVQEQHRRNLPT